MEVTIPAGAASGQKIVLPGEVDFLDPNATPADAIFTLVEQPHKVFSRKNADLAMECVISLKESICGFERTVTLLDGTTFVMKTAMMKDNDDMIRNKDVRVIKGKGMPNQNGEFGDLYVQFKVEMPGESKPKNMRRKSSNSHKYNQDSSTSSPS